MKVEITKDIALRNEIKQGLKDNGGFCPCVIEQTPETKCMCKDFRENVAVGEYCHCGLFRKISN